MVDMRNKMMQWFCLVLLLGSTLFFIRFSGRLWKSPVNPGRDTDDDEDLFASILKLAELEPSISSVSRDSSLTSPETQDDAFDNVTQQTEFKHRKLSQVPTSHDVIMSGNGSDSIQEDDEDLPLCPHEPPDLIGPIRAVHEVVGQGTLELQYFVQPDPPYPPLTLGGQYRPPDCLAWQKVAIVVPYRARYAHLHILLNNLLPVLRRQQINFRFFVIDQDNPTTFNRGMLQNVGFLEALKLGDFDCFIFHDVDMVPLNDYAFYRCNQGSPLHVTAGISKYNYGLPYGGYYGGILAFTRDQYQNINGFSNLYFGWGGEDDDVFARLMHRKYKMLRYPRAIGKFDMIKHKSDKGNEANPDRMGLLHRAIKRQSVEGLSTTKYVTTGIQVLPLYTWIHVYINMTEVLQTAPEDCQPLIKNLMIKAKSFDNASNDGKLLLPYERSHD